MKVFEYNYYERWGNGCGIIIAESVDHAKELLCKSYLEKEEKSIVEILDKEYPNIEFTEIDITEPQIIDHSYME